MRVTLPTAVVSDIHGNAVALRAVLDDIRARGVDRIVCLGDIIGYGPDPLETIDLVRTHCAWSLMGNHDFGVLYEPTNFNAPAEAAAFWTREQLDAEPDDTLRNERYDFLGRLRVRIVETIPPGPDGAGANGAGPNGPGANGPGVTVLAVHASPRRPINEYIFPDDVMEAPEKLESIFRRVDRLALCGHTHVPGVFTNEPDFYPPSELGDQLVYRFITDEKAVINVGSVGQPRDLDPRASYAILYPDRVEFVRVAYDIKATADKIKAIPQLVDWLGDRLFEGR